MFRLAPHAWRALAVYHIHAIEDKTPPSEPAETKAEKEKEMAKDFAEAQSLDGDGINWVS